MSYVVDLDAFHGPLDLLLYLIDKNEIDIYDIPVADITEQYMQHINLTGDYDLDRLGDFLSMASYLLNLKSRMLLPAGEEEDQEDGEEELDPREELVQKLLEYRRYKQAAEYLLARQRGELARVFYRKPEDIPAAKEQVEMDINVLYRAFCRIVKEVPEIEEQQLIPDSDVSVEEKMGEIMNHLQDFKAEIYFKDLFRGMKKKKEILAMFLALLELVRMQKVTAVQDVYDAEIVICLRVGM